MNISKVLKKLSTFVLASVMAVCLGTQSAHAITVGGKNYTEQQLLAEMTAQMLRAKGFNVDKKAGMGSTVLRAAQENGQIDLYWELTGTSLITFNKVTDKLNADQTYRRVKELDAAKGIVWLNPSKANNTYALALRRVDSDALKIKSMSDLAKAVNGGSKFSFASNIEFAARPDGLIPMQATYGFEFARENVRRMDSGLTYQALKDKQVDVALVFATDGRNQAFDFVMLIDDKGFFPSYNITPVIRKVTMDANPALVPLLNALSAKLDDATMRKLNSSVDVEKKTIEEVATKFLKDSGIL
jgi:osmoprotectant transport system substrate-binding protein